MNPSIRRRLLFFLLSATAFIWSIVTLVSYFDSRQEIEKLFDARLVQTGKAVILLTRHELYEQLSYEGQQRMRERNVPEQIYGEAHPYEQAVAFQIWLGQDHLAVRSSSAPQTPLGPFDNGFSNRDVNGEPWRIYTVAASDQPMAVMVGEKMANRTVLENSITWRFLGAIVLAMPLLATLIWIGIGRALRPMQRLAQDVGARGVDSLESINADQTPIETRPLVDALNTLFARVHTALEKERRFTADAAHELRTPLAAVKTHAQVAQRAQDHSERDHALRHVVDGVNRTTHLVEQLLTLARLDPDAVKHRGLKLAPVAVCDVAARTLADLAPAALGRNVELSLNEDCTGTALGEEAMLGVLLRNLIENAIHHTPSGGQVAVSVKTDADGVRIVVEDSGPGIPAADRERVFQRFYRRLGTDAPGSGLGLSIVQRVIEIHQARIRLGEAALGGLKVEVTLPIAPPAPRAAKN